MKSPSDGQLCAWKPTAQMKPEDRIRPMTDLDGTVAHLLPFSENSSGFLYAVLLTATLALSVLSVIFFL
jgi:hypothetical protein